MSKKECIKGKKLHCYCEDCMDKAKKEYDEVTKQSPEDRIIEKFDKYFGQFNVPDLYKYKKGLERKGFSELEIKEFLRQSLSDYKKEIISEVIKVKNRFKCGKCEGARVQEHTHCCKALSEIKDLLNNL